MIRHRLRDRRGSRRQAEAVQDLADRFGRVNGCENSHPAATTITNENVGPCYTQVSNCTREFAHTSPGRTGQPLRAYEVLARFRKLRFRSTWSARLAPPGARSDSQTSGVGEGVQHP